MDLLCSRYASPFELIRTYIEHNRFGELVDSIINMDRNRREEESERNSDNKLWIAYLLSHSDLCFGDWKSSLIRDNRSPESYAMTDDEINAVKGKVRGILKGFNM